MSRLRIVAEVLPHASLNILAVVRAEFRCEFRAIVNTWIVIAEKIEVPWGTIF